MQPPFWAENKKELYDMIRTAPIVIEDEVLTSEGTDLLQKAR